MQRTLRNRLSELRHLFNEERNPDELDSKPERPDILSGLAHRVQQGVRATIDALGQSYAQRLAAIVEIG